MSIKSFLMKTALRAKGVSKDQAEIIAQKLSANPELADSLKQLESNPQVKALFEKIQKEIEEKKNSGMADEYATVLVLGKYKTEMLKYRDILAPLMSLMQK